MAKAKKIDLKTLVKHIKSAKKILIATHVGPDGDGIGSILALGAGIRKLGKKVTCYMQDPVPRTYCYLPGHAKIAHKLKTNEKYDLSFIVDLGEIERGGEEFFNFPGRGLTISIDHHAKGGRTADLDFCLPKQASSGEVAYKVLKALKAPLDKAMATCLYTAMVTDTGSFKYSNTSKETFDIAADLMNYKVDVWQVAQNCFETTTKARLELLKRVLPRMQIHESGKIAWFDLLDEDFKAAGATRDDSEGFINYPRSVEGVEVALQFRQADAGVYKVSLRSKNYFDVAEVAMSYGGGGHIRASGLTAKGDLETIRRGLLAKIVAKLK